MVDSIAPRLDLPYRTKISAAAVLSVGVAVVSIVGLRSTLGTVYPTLVVVGLGLLVGLGVFTTFALQLRERNA